MMPTDESFTNGPFDDALLRDALRRRPEPVLSEDFARRVVRAAERRPATPPPRPSRLPGVASALAGVLVLLAIAWGGLRLAALHAAASSAAEWTSGSTTYDSVAALLVVGCGALFAAVVYVALQTATDDEARFTAL